MKIEVLGVIGFDRDNGILERHWLEFISRVTVFAETCSRHTYSCLDAHLMVCFATLDGLLRSEIDDTRSVVWKTYIVLVENSTFSICSAKIISFWEIRVSRA